MSEQDWQKALIAFATMIGTGIVGWAGMAIQRSVRAGARSDREVALAEYQEALADERKAAANDDPNDDVAAHRRTVLAKIKAEKLKKLVAMIDGATQGSE